MFNVNENLIQQSFRMNERIFKIKQSAESEQNSAKIEDNQLYNDQR